MSGGQIDENAQFLYHQFFQKPCGVHKPKKRNLQRPLDVPFSHLCCWDGFSCRLGGFNKDTITLPFVPTNLDIFLSAWLKL
jgi:hypothetical protein